jgi:hypothetical protein
MGLFDKIFKVTTLDQIKNAFDFLITDFSFELQNVESHKGLKADNFLIYRNENSKLQVEICADESWFHCELRRIVNGQPTKYSDKKNCIGFEDLAILESNHKYDHFDYYAGGSNGLKGVLENTSKLFKRNSHFFTTANWIDIQKIETLKDQEFTKQFGKIPDKSTPTYFDKLRDIATKLFLDNGFSLTLDSEELSPFENNSMTNKLIFKKDEKVVEVSQVDWRDDYFMYQIINDNTKIFNVDTSKIELDRAVELTINKLKTCL